MSAININKDNYISEVINSEKPVLLDFWAPRCGPCQTVLPIVDEIAKEREDIKVAKVNVDEEMKLARQFKVMGIPTLVVMKGGEVINRSTGVKNKDEILAML